MAVHTLQRVQKIPATLQELWTFFSDAANLQRITPESMSFHILSPGGQKIFAGQLIEYTLRPLLGIKVYWMSEITHVREPYFFVDEQRKGPYAFWRHQHLFREIEGGVEMTDIVHYQNSFWLVGRLANWLLVEGKLTKIFDYRRQKI